MCDTEQREYSTPADPSARVLHVEVGRLGTMDAVARWLCPACGGRWFSYRGKAKVADDHGVKRSVQVSECLSCHRRAWRRTLRDPLRLLPVEDHD